MTYLDQYLATVSEETPEAVASIKKTAEHLYHSELVNFDYMSHDVGLLLGQVQSGKTGQMFGVLSAAADAGFELFLVLTSSMTALQQQTFERAFESLEGFNICNENDEIRFFKRKLKSPTVVVLKKNATVLRKWKNHLASSGYCNGRPIFIIDDEADATSLNTKVNSPDLDKSTINQLLDDIKRLCTSSFFLQVTATPQPILLQSLDSGWKPKFVHYFEPGKNYLGGTFFYSKPKPFTNVSTDDDELQLLLETDEIPRGLCLAALTYLVTCAQMDNKSVKVCNFLVHPSHRIEDHSIIAAKLKRYVDRLIIELIDGKHIDLLEEVYSGLRESKPDILDFNRVIDFLKKSPKFKFITMNSGPDSESAPDINSGFNIVIGGNSLGRGVTFKGLQTVYYLRYSKKPQADTFWQHSRMFGYDRDPSLMRVFMPVALYNLFAEINNSNEVLYEQIKEGKFDDLQIMLSPSVKPTRSNVIDREKINVLVGGVNYFPPEPDQTNAFNLDPELKEFEDGLFHIEITQATAILKHMRDDKINNWDVSAFVDALDGISKQRTPVSQVALIVRRNRDIGRQTGTMLAETDRRLGDEIKDLPVVTMYRNAGNSLKGWDGSPFWMTNLKLPANKVFYTTRN